MTWKFWKWGRVPAQVKQDKGASPVPFLTIAVDPEGKLSQYAHLPAVHPDKAEGCADNFAMMLFLLNRGRLLATLQRAVAAGGEAGPASDWMAQRVMARLNSLVAEADRDEGKKDARPDRPLVGAREVFGYSSEQE